MEYVKCNFCNNNDTKLLFSKKDKFGLSDCDFRVVQCRICGLIYVNPRLSGDEIAEHIKEIRKQAKQLELEAKEALEQAKQKVEKMILG